MKNARLPETEKTSAADTAQSKFLTTANQVSPHVALLMSSREIAELTGKDHKNVLADVRAMLAELGISSAEFSAQYKDSTGRLLPMFVIPKDLTVTLVSGYSVVMRHRIVTRWQELESQSVQSSPTAVIPQTLPEALRLAADLAEKVEQTRAQLAVTAPKAAALDRIADARDGITITRAAKDLKVNPHNLFTMLSERAWIYKREGSKAWSAYQRRINDGCLMHRVTTVERPDGTPKLVEQVLVTPKGLVKLAELLSQETAGA